MNPDPTIVVSLDYLVELTDDGKHPDHVVPEIIVIPPGPLVAAPSLPPPNVSEQIVQPK